MSNQPVISVVVPEDPKKQDEHVLDAVISEHVHPDELTKNVPAPEKPYEPPVLAEPKPDPKFEEIVRAPTPPPVKPSTPPPPQPVLPPPPSAESIAQAILADTSLASAMSKLSGANDRLLSIKQHLAEARVRVAQLENDLAFHESHCEMLRVHSHNLLTQKLRPQ
jgi:hypothetical protein